MHISPGGEPLLFLATGQAIVMRCGVVREHKVRLDDTSIVSCPRRMLCGRLAR
jgi:hypothetical protein